MHDETDGEMFKHYFPIIIKPQLDEGLQHLKQHFLQIRQSEGENVLISKAEYIELLVSSFLLYSWTKDYYPYNVEKSKFQETVEDYIVNFLETQLN